MATTDAVDLARRASGVLREEGPVEFARASVDYLEARRDALATRTLNRCGGLRAARKYLRVRRTVSPGTITDADPFALVRVDPRDVRYVEETTPRKWGRVRGGVWDRTTTRLEETAEYRDIRSHFVDGVPWERTSKWEGYVRRLERGETPKGCTTREELRERLERVDEIYERIRTEGYRSQRDLWEAEPDRQRASFYKWGRTIDPRLDEVTVTIGRDGRLFHRGRAHHRLTIARVLGLESIPVLVRTRHAGWQAIRDDLRAASSVEELGEPARSALDHPDLRPLRSALER